MIHTYLKYSSQKLESWHSKHMLVIQKRIRLFSEFINTWNLNLGQIYTLIKMTWKQSAREQIDVWYLKELNKNVFFYANTNLLIHNDSKLFYITKNNEKVFSWLIILQNNEKDIQYMHTLFKLYKTAMQKSKVINDFKKPANRNMHIIYSGSGISNFQ